MAARRLKNRHLLVAVCLMTALSSRSHARQDQRSASETQGAEDACLGEARCNELYENARALSEAGQYEAALVSYQSAYARQPVPWLLINIGRMQQKAGRPQQAIATYKRFLDDPAAAGDVELQSTARKYLQQAEDEVKGQQPVLRVPSGQATALARPPSAAAPEQSRPLYKKWWLWTTVGAVVAATAVGVGIGLASAQPDVSTATAVRPFGN